MFIAIIIEFYFALFSNYGQIQQAYSDGLNAYLGQNFVLC